MESNSVSPMPELAPIAEFDKTPPTPPEDTVPLDDLPPPPNTVVNVQEEKEKEAAAEAKEKNYVTEKYVAAYLNRAAQSVSKQTCSKERGFLFKIHCFLCGHEVPADYNKKQIKHTPAKRNMVYLKRTLSMREKVMKLAEGRNDEYGQSVLRRLQQVDDLCAADAQYHFRCMRDLHHVPKSQNQLFLI
ncbi:unnamed protein product [Psylliodes chrysocephalus]|uniref:Uncharacterized protein n=1 Tax=Psylliodes chrysocephalus TaxID=3402493 RepID=A0A9P0CWC1_9CUCU|nr:unnamed protein product [Psylliodes chrysocephala]